MKYRKKPVVIDAIQWTDNTTEIKEFCGNKCTYEVDDAAWEVGKGIPKEYLTIHTLEGDYLAKRGDYIIKGVQGEFYPCKPDIFKQTYEKLIEYEICTNTNKTCTKCQSGACSFRRYMYTTANIN